TTFACQLNKMLHKILYSCLKIRGRILLILLAAMYFFACTKSSQPQAVQNNSIFGKWKLTMSCHCDTCIDSSAFNSQLLEFLPDSTFQVTAVQGDPVRQCTGTYSIDQQPGGDILNIKMDTTCTPDFLYIPGSRIHSQTSTTLVLDLNVKFGNPCIYRNTYVMIK
ncbi:MAG: hypothetical protein ACRDE5_10720, partial [Ginsengibacter sp.]